MELKTKTQIIFCCLNENLTTFLYTLFDRLALWQGQQENKSVYKSRMLLKKIWVLVFIYLVLVDVKERSLDNFQMIKLTLRVELVSKELNHFGVIADLFRQIGGHSSRFVLFCSFWRLFTIKMIKSVKVFPFSFWKIITIFFFYFIKFKPPA